MKKAMSLLLLLTLLLQCSLKTITVARFFAQQDYIVKNLCENRLRPMLHCRGKCQLKKQLEKQEKQEKQNPVPEKQETESFCTWPGAIRLAMPAYTVLQHQSRYMLRPYYTFIPSPFHPPPASIA